MGERVMRAVTWDPCKTCSGTGAANEFDTCEVCRGCGWVPVHHYPTPADLLTDPRVRALVEELDWVFSGTIQRASRRESIEAALRPFKGVPYVG